MTEQSSPSQPSSTDPAGPVGRSSDQHEKARLFHQLHAEGMLVLPNAWDVASARLVEDAGAAAVATTSAGVSWSVGVPDGEQLSREQAVDLIARTVAAVNVPVTADIESGYGVNDDQLSTTVRAVLAVGAVGINLEDSATGELRAVEEQAERLGVVRAIAEGAGVPLFINARTGTYLLEAGEPTERLAATVRRSEAYVGAGAHGVFVPGVIDRATIRDLARLIPAPLNVMAGPGAPTVAEMADLGVRRVSVGMAIAQAAYALARRASVQLLTRGTYSSMAGGLGYAELNAVLSRR